MKKLTILMILAGSAFGQYVPPAGTPGACGTPDCHVAGNIQVDGNGTINGTVTASTVLTSFVSGAQALYLMSETSGTTVHDTSGNSRDGTVDLGNNEWSRGGLTFTNPNGGISVPVAALNGALTFQIWMYNPSGAKGSSIVLYTDSLNAAVSQMGGFFFGNGSYIGKCTGYCSFSMTGNGAYFNGLPAGASWTDTSVASPMPIPTTVGFHSIGLPGFASEAPGTVILAVAIYGTSLTNAQIGQNEAAAKSLFNARGVGYALNVDAAESGLIFVGDSITSSTVTNPPYPVYTAARFPGFSAWNVGVYGMTLATMNTLYAKTTSVIMPKMHGQVPVVSIFGGTNDIASNTAYTTVANYYNSYCDSVHDSTNNFQVSAWCIVGTMLPRSSFSGGQETARQNFNALIASRWTGGTITANGVADFANDPIMGSQAALSNVTYYADGVHPAAAGMLILADREEMAIRQTMSPRVPFWLTMNVPYWILTAAATTQTVNLLQLGPGQQVCGVGKTTTAAFSGGTIATITASVGDSGGATTSYGSAGSVATTGGTQVWTPFQSSGGIVQATFVTTVDNLSSLTAGNLKISVCVATQ